MRISKAYCEQTQEILDIYEAKSFFFNQPMGANGDRPRLSFLCSDERCRAMNPEVKITGVNYHRSFEEEDAFRSPHFRENDEHHPECEWTQKELDQVAIQAALDDGTLDEDVLPNRHRRVARGKEHDLIDQFWLEAAVPEPVQAEEEEPIIEVQEQRLGNGARQPNEAGERQRQIRVAPLVSHALHELVTCFQELSVEEQQLTSLTIGRNGQQRNYYQCFRPINHLNWNGLTNIVFFGNARVKRYGNAQRPTGYYITFYQKIEINVNDENEEVMAEEKQICLYLTIDQLQVAPYWNQYAQYLNKAHDDDDCYIRCFLFLPQEPRNVYDEERPYKVDIQLPSIVHIDLMLVRKGGV